MLSEFELREKKYDDAAREQEMILTELDVLVEGTELYNEKVDRVNELGKITGVFY